MASQRQQLMDEYMVRVRPKHLADEYPDTTIPICGLCGNSGKISMVVPYSNAVEPVRLEAFCLCDNGRWFRRRERRRARWEKG